MFARSLLLPLWKTYSLQTVRTMCSVNLCATGPRRSIAKSTAPLWPTADGRHQLPNCQLRRSCDGEYVVPEFMPKKASFLMVHSFIDFHLQIPANAAPFDFFCTLGAAPPLPQRTRASASPRRPMTLKTSCLHRKSCNRNLRGSLLSQAAAARRRDDSRQVGGAT